MVVKIMETATMELVAVTTNGSSNGFTCKEFMAYKPKEPDDKGGALAYIWWSEKMETVINIGNRAVNQRVMHASCSLTGRAMTWWNTQVQARGREVAIGIAWDEFKALMKKELWWNNEMQKSENEFRNHTMVGAGHTAYTDLFRELVELVLPLVIPEFKHINRYIYELVPQDCGTVATTDPPAIQRAILKTGALTGEMVRNGKVSRSDKKRKEISNLNLSCVIKFTNSNYVKLDKVIYEYTLVLDEHSLSIDLLPFGLRSFNVVGDMDWLSSLGLKAYVIRR